MNKLNNAFTLRFSEVFLILLIFVGSLIFAGLLQWVESFIIWPDNLHKLSLILINVVPLLGAIGFAYYLAKQKEQQLSLGSAPRFLHLLLLIPLTTCLIILSNYTTSLVPHNAGFLKALYETYEQAFMYLRHPWWIFILATCVLAPLLEEILFRGIFLNGLINKASTQREVWIAIIFTGFLFGFIHMNPWQFIAGWFAGIVFGYIYVYTRSLWATVFAHFINNAVSVFFIFYYDALDPDELQDIPYFYGLIALGLLPILLFSIKKRSHKSKLV